MSTKFEIIKSRLVSLTTMAGVNIIMHVMNGGHRVAYDIRTQVAKNI